MGAYIYLRISKEYNLERSSGLEAQEHACRRWAALKDIPVCGVFTEAAITGTSSLKERPKLMEALDQIQNQDVLLVSKRDRLGRSIQVMLEIEKIIREKNARIISASGEGTEGDSPTDILMRSMIDAFSEFECNIIKERTKVALAAKKSRGEKIGCPPYGFRIGKDKRLEEVPEEQEVINLIRDLRNNGTTLFEIARNLNKRGFLTSRGEPWTDFSVLGITKNYKLAKRFSSR